LASGQVTDILEIYDPALDEWIRGAPLPQPVSAYAFTSFEGRLYLFGGWNGEEYLDTVYAYDRASDVWHTRTPMRVERAYAGAVLSGDEILVIGGHNGEKPLRDNDVYSTSADDGNGTPWSLGVPLPSGRYGMGITGIADIIYIIGGFSSEDKPLPSIHLLPLSSEWQEFKMPITQSWSHMAVLPLGTQLYVLGGGVNGSPTDQQISYQAIYTISLPIVR
jgi:hypothetical protein